MFQKCLVHKVYRDTLIREMGVIREPRKILIQTGDSNSEQSSAPATDDESGRRFRIEHDILARP